MFRSRDDGGAEVDPDDPIVRLLGAAAFAARAHDGAKRKDGKTPYVSHVFRVCLVARVVFGVEDPEILAAALLHDTLEDTTTDFDDLEREQGAAVARRVAALSKDCRMPEAEREAAYRAALAAAEPAVKICKLADMLDNLIDMDNLPADRRRRAVGIVAKYAEALRPDGPDAPHARAWEIVRRALIARGADPSPEPLSGD